jgi:hypothetical protein
MDKNDTWPRDGYTGPGGGLSTGPGGGMSTGPGGGLSTGPGGGLSNGPGGGLFTGPGGGLSTGPGGGLSTAPGGGRYTGPCSEPYRSNQPPREALLAYLSKHNRHDILRRLEDAGFEHAELMSISFRFSFNN